MTVIHVHARKHLIIILQDTDPEVNRSLTDTYHCKSLATKAGQTGFTQFELHHLAGYRSYIYSWTRLGPASITPTLSRPPVYTTLWTAPPQYARSRCLSRVVLYE